MSAKKLAKKRPEPTIAETFLSRTVSIKVGPSKKVYQVHKPILTYHSEYFRAAFQPGNFKEDVDGESTLEDIGTVAFEVFIDWLYSKDLPEIRKGKWFKYGGNNGPVCRYIAELNVLADRLIVDELKGLALELSVNMSNLGHLVHALTIQYAFSNLLEDHPFLQILVDHYCLNWAAEDNMKLKQHFICMPREFLFRVLIKYSERKRESNRLQLKDYCKN